MGYSGMESSIPRKYQLESFSKAPPIILPYPLGKAIEAGKEDYLEQNSYCQFAGG